MQLTKHHHEFEVECRQMIGHVVREVEYTEVNYYPQNPKPCYATDHPQVHTVDLSVRLLTGPDTAVEIFWKTLKIYWEKEFLDYGLNIRFAKTASLPSQQTWNVSEETIWKDFLGQTITDVKVHWTKTWIESPKSKAVMDYTFPQTIAISFENNKAVYISAAEFEAGHRYHVVKGINNLLVTTSEAVGKKTYMLTANNPI